MNTPLRIAVVGPTYPYSGGVSSHTTTMANRLIADGHSVQMISWKAQYPKFLRDARVPDGEPEVAPVPGTMYPLAWYDPFGWFRIGRRLRRADIVAVTAVTPYHAVPYLVMRAAFGSRPRAIVIAHNVLPHERGKADRILNRRLYRALGRVVTHSPEQARLATEIAASDRVQVAASRMPLPDFLFDDAAASGSTAMATAPEPSKRGVTLVFFGMIREYKGVDLLLDAMARVADVRLILAGEFWEDVAGYRARISELGLDDRVEIIEGYLKLSELPALFGRADALVLPYRRGSATFNVDLGFRFGLPVIASDAGTLARDIRDRVDGLVTRSGDVESLVEALRMISDPGVLARLKAGVDPGRTDEQWRQYDADLVGLAGFESP